MSEAGRVLLIDDHAVVRAGCRQLLEGWGGFEVIEAASATDALDLVEKETPALAVVDLNLREGSGLDLIPRLLARRPGLRVLVFTMHEEASTAARAIERGAHGFVTKSDAPEIIVEAVRRIADGEIYLSRPVAQKLALLKVTRAGDPLAVLTRREQEALRALAEGKTLSEIAARLGVSYKTAANTCSQIKAKLKASSTAELIRLALTLSDQPPPVRT